MKNNQLKIYLSFILMFAFSCVNFAQNTNKTYTCKIQTKELWRELADSGRYNEAIKILLDSADICKNSKSIYWHIGQLYACNNDYDLAIKYMKKSSSFFDKLFDKEWRLYFNGTLAFLNRDKKKLNFYYQKLWKKHSEYYYSNAFLLKTLNENFDLNYCCLTKL